MTDNSPADEGGEHQNGRDQNGLNHPECDSRVGLNLSRARAGNSGRNVYANGYCHHWGQKNEQHQGGNGAECSKLPSHQFARFLYGPRLAGLAIRASIRSAISSIVHS